MHRLAVWWFSDIDIELAATAKRNRKVAHGQYQEYPKVRFYTSLRIAVYEIGAKYINRFHLFYDTDTSTSTPSNTMQTIHRVLLKNLNDSTQFN